MTKFTKIFDEARTFDGATAVSTMLGLVKNLKEQGVADGAYSLHLTLDKKRVLGVREVNGEWGYVASEDGQRNAGEFIPEFAKRSKKR